MSGCCHSGPRRRDRHLTHALHKVPGVIVLIRAQRDPLAPTEHVHKLGGSIPFGRARCLRHPGTHHQTVPVLHQNVSKASQLRFEPLLFLNKYA